MRVSAAFLTAVAIAALAGSAMAQSGGYQPYRPYEVKPYNPYELDKKHPEVPPKNPYDLHQKTDPLSMAAPGAAARAAREAEKYNHRFDPVPYTPPSYGAPKAPRTPRVDGRCYLSNCQ